MLKELLLLRYFRIIIFDELESNLKANVINLDQVINLMYLKNTVMFRLKNDTNLIFKYFTKFNFLI